jgi:hypothetical protein
MILPLAGVTISLIWKRIRSLSWFARIRPANSLCDNASGQSVGSISWPRPGACLIGKRPALSVERIVVGACWRYGRPPSITSSSDGYGKSDNGWFPEKTAFFLDLWRGADGPVRVPGLFMESWPRHTGTIRAWPSSLFLCSPRPRHANMATGGWSLPVSSLRPPKGVGSCGLW